MPLQIVCKLIQNKNHSVEIFSFINTFASECFLIGEKLMKLFILKIIKLETNKFYDNLNKKILSYKICVLTLKYFKNEMDKFFSSKRHSKRKKLSKKNFENQDN